MHSAYVLCRKEQQVHEREEKQRTAERTAIRVEDGPFLQHFQLLSKGDGPSSATCGASCRSGTMACFRGAVREAAIRWLTMHAPMLAPNSSEISR